MIAVGFAPTQKSHPLNFSAHLVLCPINNFTKALELGED
jgi:hypothetical protein